MSITKELQAPGKNPCKLCTFMLTLDEADRKELADNLALPVTVVGNKAVVAFMGRRGITLDETSVRRHRSNHGNR